MSISYSSTSLTRALVGGGFLQLKTKANPEAALQVFWEASHAAEQQFDDLQGELVSSLGISPADGGPILSLHLCDTEAALQRYLTELTEQLERSGISGRLLPARDIETPHLRPGAPAVTAALALVTDYDEMLSRPRIYDSNPDPLWWVSRERTERVLPELVNWCLEGPGDLYFRSGIGLSITADQALPLFSNAKARDQSATLTKVTDDATGMRSLYAGVGGEVVLQSYEPDLGWKAQVQSMRKPVISVASDVLNAFVRINVTGTLGRSEARDQPPPPPLGRIPGGWIWRTVHLEGHYVPDAYGMQVITADHLRSTTDLSPERWLVEGLGDDRHLVTSRALEDWFDTDYSPYAKGDPRYTDPSVPAPATLALARRDFGTAILTREVVEANPLPAFTGTIRR